MEGEAKEWGSTKTDECRETSEGCSNYFYIVLYYSPDKVSVLLPRMRKVKRFSAIEIGKEQDH